MKLHFSVRRVTFGPTNINAKILFSEKTTGQFFELIRRDIDNQIYQGSSSARDFRKSLNRIDENIQYVTFSFSDIQNKSIDIQVFKLDQSIDGNAGQEIGHLNLPCSIFPFDHKVSAKFRLQTDNDDLQNEEKKLKIFIIIHLSTFGQLPFFAKKGSLVKRLKDVTKSPRAKEPNTKKLTKCNGTSSVSAMKEFDDVMLIESIEKANSTNSDDLYPNRKIARSVTRKRPSYGNYEQAELTSLLH